MSEENKVGLDLGGIDFTPAWAKEAPKSTIKVRPERETKRESSGSKTQFDRAKKPVVAKRARQEERRQFVEREKPLEVEIKVLPETHALGTIMRKLQQDFHAYKLKDLAYFFLDNPQSVLLRIVSKGEAGAKQFFQCKVCGLVAKSEQEVAEHILTAHLGEYYDSREIEVEPPKGNFNCVAKCGLSGVWLGPPNIHEFNATVREMIRTRYPNISESEYRSRIEMVRDAEAIEEWRKGATKRVVFFAKGTAEQEGAVSLSREQAEGEFKRTILSSLIDNPKTLMVTADIALKSPIRALAMAVRNALEKERMAPYEMCFALRGAFHHRKLKFFRVNDSRGLEFVTNVEYREFDAEHAIPELAAVAKFIAENPCCDRSELPSGEETDKLISWLVSTGHVVAFINGVYSAVEKFPKYGPQWKKRRVRVESGEEESRNEMEVDKGGLSSDSILTQRTQNVATEISVTARPSACDGIDFGRGNCKQEDTAQSEVNQDLSCQSTAKIADFALEKKKEEEKKEEKKDEVTTIVAE